MDSILELLNRKASQYNTTSFIESDPISIPHKFSQKQDVEISGFLTSIIAWGRRTAIINKANHWMELMDKEPYNFVVNSSDIEYKRFVKFVYRTFNGDDCLFLVSAIRDLYREYGGLESVFTDGYNNSNNIMEAIVYARKKLFLTPHLKRSEKHIANPLSGSAAKRINMFLRWMIRNDGNGVDFGIWKHIPQSALMCPLDVHSGNVARKFGLLKRKQNDWKAVEELTEKLREFDPQDPVKYDFALFGMGVFEGIS